MDKELIAGVDEVGRGCLAGPVVSASVILDKNKKVEGLKDSKLLTPKKREFLYKEINEKAISIGIGSCSPKIIDKINIREATFSSMRIAIKNLSIKPEKLLIDGDPIEKVNIPNRGIVKGDNKIHSIMAASIIAKVTRDRLMMHYSNIFPEYDFQNNKGYGTKNHLKALIKNKSTPIHRNSFKPVKENISTLEWIIKNKKTNWLGKKLAGLFLMRINHKILTMDFLDLKTNTKIDIVSQSKKKIIFTEVLASYKNDIKAEENITIYDKKNIYKEIKNEFFPKFEHRIDRIYIRIKNGPPDINRIVNIDI